MYSVVVGDTFEIISRKQYGTEQYASNISQANPGASDPLQAGTTLIIPVNPAGLENRLQTAQAANRDEVAVLIESTRFRFWTEIRLSRRVDGMATIELSAPFEPSQQSFRDTFRPFSFKTIEITVGGEVLFRGTMVTVRPSLEDQKTVRVSAYAFPGVLNDCTAPASAYPIEYNSQNLQAITESIIKPFGLTATFTSSPGSVFDRVAMQPEQRILTFLSGLAKQRGLVISSTERGALLFQKSVTVGLPVARLRQGESPLVSVAANFNPQEYYSHVTGIEPMVIGLDGESFTVKNTRLNNVLRPFTFQAPDTESGTLKGAVEAKAGRMVGNMVSYSVTVNTWRDPAGSLWSPNTILNLQADNAMVYSPYNFLIRSVDFIRNERSKTAILEVVLPGAFSGRIPEVLPWD